MPLPAGFDEKAEHTYEFRAMDDVLSLSVDGQELVSVRDGTIDQPGRCHTYGLSGLEVRAIQWLTLDGAAAPK